MPTETKTLNDLSIRELQSRAKAAGLGTSRSKAALIERLEAIPAVRVTHHVHGTTLCRICRAKTKVTNTKKHTMADGRSLITRQMRCVGKHRHTYPLREIVKQ